MKTSDLKRVQQPEPVQPQWKMCLACKAYKAECYVPIGDGSAQMCWLCAHAVVEHNCPLHEAATNECECLPHEVYPNRPKPIAEMTRCEAFDYGYSIGEATTLRFPHGDINPRRLGPYSLTGHFYNPKTGAIETVVDDKVVAILGVPVDSTPIAAVGKRRVRRKPL